MSYVLPFGKNRGHSLEWLFFHDLSYLRWIIGENIYEQRDKFPEAAKASLEELVFRSEHLAPLCSKCRRAKAYRMVFDELTFQFRCRECDRTTIHPAAKEEPWKPSFLVRDDPYNSVADVPLLRGIKQAYFGSPGTVLHPGQAEQFFNNLENFDLPPDLRLRR